LLDDGSGLTGDVDHDSPLRESEGRSNDDGRSDEGRANPHPDSMAWLRLRTIVIPSRRGRPINLRVTKGSVVVVREAVAISGTRFELRETLPQAPWKMWG